jgi:hypothetical protein
MGMKTDFKMSLGQFEDMAVLLGVGSVPAVFQGLAGESVWPTFKLCGTLFHWVTSLFICQTGLTWAQISSRGATSRPIAEV